MSQTTSRLTGRQLLAVWLWLAAIGLVLGYLLFRVSDWAASL